MQPTGLGKISRRQAVFLQLCFPAATPRSDYVLKEMGIAAFFDALRQNKPPAFLTKADLAHLHNASAARTDAILHQVDADGQRVICFGDPEYPEELAQIVGSPICLYAKGNVALLQARLRICVVGSRRISDYAMVAAGNLGYQLAQAGAVVVSGLARGTDGVAHTGALIAAGDTIAVSGCGLDIQYPEKNTAMAAAIAQHGLRLSEYPPGVHPKSGHFPVRNRILAGISLGTVMVEAGVSSGAMITAACALEMGRDVFTLPNSIYDANAQGNLKLLKEGAKPISCAADILEEYATQPVYQTLVCREPTRKTPIPLQMLLPLRDKTPPGSGERERREIHRQQKMKKPVKAVAWQACETGTNQKQQNAADLFASLTAPKPERLTREQLDGKGLSKAAVDLYLQLGEQPITLAELAAPLALPTAQALTAITELEMAGLIMSYPGRRYALFTNVD